MMFEPTFTLGAISSILAVVGTGYGINAAIRKRHRENQQDAQDREDRLRADLSRHHETVDDRVKTLEVAARDFMPRSEILNAIAHEKAGRLQVQEGQQRTIDRLTGDVTEIRIDVGRLRERNEGMAADIGEIKALLKEQGRDTAARFDRMGEQIAAITHAPR